MSMETIRVQDAVGKTGRTVAVRVLPGTDLLTGIIEVCRKNNITYGYIPVCFGSLQRAGYLYLVPNREAKLGAGYGAVNRAEGPVEFLSGVGVICQRDGNYDIHFHASMCDKEGRVFGGHLVVGENPVLTTVDAVITEIEGVKLLRKFDEETALIQFLPEQA